MKTRPFAVSIMTRGRGEMADDGMAARGMVGMKSGASEAGSAGDDGEGQSTSSSGTGALQEVKKTRTSFPESWIWAETFMGYCISTPHPEIANCFPISCLNRRLWG